MVVSVGTRPNKMSALPLCPELSDLTSLTFESLTFV